MIIKEISNNLITHRMRKEQRTPVHEYLPPNDILSKTMDENAPYGNVNYNFQGLVFII